jgi:hypothetical protein
MKIRIEFKTDNASFGERHSPEYHAEVCFVLSKVTSKITNGAEFGTIRDTNGNSIGEFSAISPDDEGDETP